MSEKIIGEMLKVMDDRISLAKKLINAAEAIGTEVNDLRKLLETETAIRCLIEQFLDWQRKAKTILLDSRQFEHWGTLYNFVKEIRDFKIKDK